jgi:hypothetical protein
MNNAIPISNVPALTTLPTEFSMIGAIISFALVLLLIIAEWKIYVKAGQPGWAVIVPFYNIYILLKIAGKPGWLVFLLLGMFIPIINILVMIAAFVISIIVSLDIAKAFGRSSMFGFFLLFLFSPIGYMILGYGKSQYVGAENSGQLPSPNVEQVPPQFSQQYSQQTSQQANPQQPSQQNPPPTPVS